MASPREKRGQMMDWMGQLWKEGRHMPKQGAVTHPPFSQPPCKGDVLPIA